MLGMAIGNHDIDNDDSDNYTGAGDDSHAICIEDWGTLKEFMMATDMTASGSPEEKLRWAFKMYDKDGSGGPVKKHLVKIRPTILSVSFGTCLFQ